MILALVNERYLTYHFLLETKLKIKYQAQTNIFKSKKLDGTPSYYISNLSKSMKKNRLSCKDRIFLLLIVIFYLEFVFIHRYRKDIDYQIAIIKLD